MALIDNLIEYWPLNENIASGSRTGLHASKVLTDTNTNVAAGTGLVYGNAATFSATQELTRSSESGLIMGDTSFTIVAWVNFSAFNASFPTIVTKGASGGADVEWSLYVWSGNRIYFQICRGAGGSSAEDVGGTTFGNPATGVWYMVTAVYDATGPTQAISVNAGSLDSRVITAGGPYVSSQPLRLGQAGSNQNPLEATLGPLVWWHRALSSAEITQVYNGGGGLTYAAMVSGGAPAESLNIVIGEPSLGGSVF